MNKSDLKKGGALLWSLLWRAISPTVLEEEIQKQRVEDELHKMRLWVFTQKLGAGFNGWLNMVKPCKTTRFLFENYQQQVRI